MKKVFNINGLSIVEIIMTLAILGIIVCPLMSIYIFSQKINNESEIEYKSMLQAQKYMEEIQVMDKLDTDKYTYNGISGAYERSIIGVGSGLNAEIKIKPKSSDLLYSIEIVLLKENREINVLTGNKIFN